MTPEFMELLELLGVPADEENANRQRNDPARDPGPPRPDAQLLLSLLEESHRIQAALVRLFLQPLIQTQTTLLRSVVPAQSRHDPASGPAESCSDGFLEVLNDVQGWILQHPIAAQAAFAQLVAEGQRFAATNAGAHLARELAKSKEIQTWRLIFESMTANVLSADPDTVLPTTCLEALQRLGAPSRLTDLINDALHHPSTESTE